MNKNNYQLPLLTFLQAKRLKELGFDWKVDNYFQLSADETVSRYRCNEATDVNNRYRDGRISAPTIPLAIKWFRDVKKMYTDGGFYVPEKKWRFYYGQQSNILQEQRTDEYETYEEAERILLEKLFEYKL